LLEFSLNFKIIGFPLLSKIFSFGKIIGLSSFLKFSVALEWVVKIIKENNNNIFLYKFDVCMLKIGLSLIIDC